MSFNYASMAATATRLLTNFGQAMAIRRVTGAAYNAVTGAVTGGTSADTACVGLFVGINASFAANFDIVAGDQIAIVDASIAPVLSDRLVVSGVVYSIVSVQTIGPAGVMVAYKLQVRS